MADMPIRKTGAAESGITVEGGTQPDAPGQSGWDDEDEEALGRETEADEL
jgi:hypothetical protein